MVSLEVSVSWDMMLKPAQGVRTYEWSLSPPGLCSYMYFIFLVHEASHACNVVHKDSHGFCEVRAWVEFAY